MCNKCNNSDQEHVAVLHGRRDFLKAGAVLASAPLLGSLVSSVHAAPTERNIGKGPDPRDHSTGQLNILPARSA